MKYKLTKPQVRRLISGGYVTDGHGRRYGAGKEMKARLKAVDENNLYGLTDIYLNDTGAVEIAVTDFRELWIKNCADSGTELCVLDRAGDAALYETKKQMPVYHVWAGDKCMVATTDYAEACDVWEAMKKIGEARE